MITLTPDKIRTRFGPLFSIKFLVMVDQKSGLAEIREQCRARGTIEWDAANRMRAKGAAISCDVEGTTMTMLARLGKSPAKFGAADREIGGQALEGVEVIGEEVVTTWAWVRSAKRAAVSAATCSRARVGVVSVSSRRKTRVSMGNLPKACCRVLRDQHSPPLPIRDLANRDLVLP